MNDREVEKRSERSSLGVYIHIPFCVKKCEYCDFISYEGKDKEIEEYCEDLKKEIHFVSQKRGREPCN